MKIEGAPLRLVYTGSCSEGIFATLKDNDPLLEKCPVGSGQVDFSVFVFMLVS